MNWPHSPLGEIAKVGAGNSAPQGDHFFSPDGVPFFRTSDVGRIRFGEIFDSADRLNESGIRKLRQVPKGTILFPKSGASTFLNHRVIIGVDGYASSHLATINADETKVLAKFLLYFLATIDAQDLVQDHAYPSLTLPVIAAIKVPTPPISEQSRIVTLLDEAFAGIAIATVNSNKNLRNAQEVFAQRLESLLSGAGLEWKRIGDLCERVEYGTSAKSKPEGEVAVLRMGNIQDGKLDWRSLVYTDDKDEIEKYLLKPGDVLFNRTNSPELVGKTAIYNGERPAIFAGYLIRINRKQDLLDAEFLNYFLNSRFALDHGRTVMTSSVHQANISGSKLMEYPIPAPSLQEQKQIVAVLDSLRQETQKLQSLATRKIAALNELKHALLHQAFSGQL